MSQHQSSDEMLASACIESIVETMRLERWRRGLARAVGTLLAALVSGMLLKVHLNNVDLPRTAAGCAVSLLAGVVFSVRPKKIFFVLVLGALALVFVRSFQWLDLAAMLGAKCTGIELAASLLGVIPVVVSTHINRDPPRAPLFAAVAGAASLCAASALHVACHSSNSAPHVLTFHVLPIGLSAALFGFVGRRWSETMMHRSSH